MKLSSIIRPAMAGLILAAASSSSHAVCCVFDSVSVVMAINASATAITGTITSTIQWSTSQITAAISGAQAADSANHREATALTSAAITRTAAVTERVRQEDRYRLTDPCSVAAPTANLSRVMSGASPATAAGNIGRSGGGGGAGPMAGASGSMQKALRVAKGQEPAPAPEIGAQAAAKGACESFASGDGVRAKSCEGAGFGASNSVGYLDADIRADTIMDGPQGAIPKKRYTVDLSGREGTAVDAFMRNINTPVMLRELKPGELSTDEGRRYMAMKDAYESRMSLAERPTRRHVAQIAATTATIPYVETLLVSHDGAFVDDYLKEFAPTWKSKGVSADEVMNLEVRRRYLNPAWQLRMAAASPEEAAKEQVQLAALQNVLLWNMIQELRESGVATSATALAQTRAELIPQLAGQHRAAAR